MMPSVSAKQHRFFGAEYGRAKAGKKTKTGMSTNKLKEWMTADSQAKDLKEKKNG
jgi:hypothetical protein